MSSWSAAPARTLLNDCNRSRWSTNPPPAENNPGSPGPAAYTSQKPTRAPLSASASSALNTGSPYRRLRRDEPTERDLTLADGKDLRKLPVAGPGDYDPDIEQEPHNERPIEVQRARPFGSASLRYVGGVPSPDPFDRKSIPGPGSYDNVFRPPSKPVPSISFGLVKREVCDYSNTQSPASSRRNSPLQSPRSRGSTAKSNRAAAAVETKSNRQQGVTSTEQQKKHSRKAQDSDKVTLVPLSTPQSGRVAAAAKSSSTNKAKGMMTSSSFPPANSNTTFTAVGGGSSTTSSSLVYKAGAGPKGGTISRTPRHLNLHDVNSRMPREKDNDFVIPPPGWYSSSDRCTTRCRGGSARFTSSARVIDLARRSCAPGPGAYDLR